VKYPADADALANLVFSGRIANFFHIADHLVTRHHR